MEVALQLCQLEDLLSLRFEDASRGSPRPARQTVNRLGEQSPKEPLDASGWLGTGVVWGSGGDFLPDALFVRSPENVCLRGIKPKARRLSKPILLINE